MLASVLSSLLMLILISIDRFVATWMPFFWSSHMKYNYRKQLKITILFVAIFSTLFAAGEVYAHAVEFFSGSGGRVIANKFHQARAYISLFPGIIITILWALTSVKMCSRIKKSRTSGNTISFVNRAFQLAIAGVAIESQTDVSKGDRTPSISKGDRTPSISHDANKKRLRSDGSEISVLFVTEDAEISIPIESRKTIANESRRSSLLDVLEITNPPLTHHPKSSCSDDMEYNAFSYAQLPSARTKFAMPSIEIKLLRIIVVMLLLFLVGYAPIISYFFLRTVHDESFAASENIALHILWACGSTGLVFASCLNPLLTILQLDDFNFSFKSKPGSVYNSYRNSTLSSTGKF